MTVILELEPAVLMEPDMWAEGPKSDEARTRSAWLNELVSAYLDQGGAIEELPAHTTSMLELRPRGDTYWAPDGLVSKRKTTEKILQADKVHIAAIREYISKPKGRTRTSLMRDLGINELPLRRMLTAYFQDDPMVRPFLPQTRESAKQAYDEMLDMRSAFIRLAMSMGYDSYVQLAELLDMSVSSIIKICDARSLRVPRKYVRTAP